MDRVAIHRWFAERTTTFFERSDGDPVYGTVAFIDRILAWDYKRIGGRRWSRVDSCFEKNPMSSEISSPGDECEVLRLRGEAGLAELFARYEDRLRRLAQFRLDPRLAGRVDAGDVLQEVYLVAARRYPEYVENPAVSFFVWLRQLTIQILVDIHRHNLKAQRRDANREVSIQHRAGSPGSSLSLAAQLVGNLTSPSQAAIRDELLEELRVAFDSMDEIDREVLTLRHFEELSNNEVAEILGLQKSAASNRYVRALKRLRQIMVKLGGVP